DGWECRYTLQYGICFHDYGIPGQTEMRGIVVKNMHIHNTGPGAYSPCTSPDYCVRPYDPGDPYGPRPDPAFAYRNQLMFLDETHYADGTQFLNNIVHDCGGHNCIQIHGDTGAPQVGGAPLQPSICYNWVHNCIDLKVVI